MLFLKVVMVVSKSQYEWVKNGDAPGQPRPNLGEIPHFAQIFLMRQTPVLLGFLLLPGGKCRVNLV